MRITYFANDLSDAAVGRRIEMLQLGGATLAVMGFRRTDKPINRVAGVDAFDLGQTYDARFCDRALKVAKRSLDARHWKDLVKGSDILLARNLEMVTIADCAKVWSASGANLVYECLDIHQSLLKPGARSRFLRAWEKRLLRRSSALIVSSPAFVDQYFGQLGVRLPKVIVAENKRLPAPGGLERPQPDLSTRGPPWRVGWFGILRCTRSFEVLRDLAIRHPDLLDVELRGRPTADVQTLIDQYLPLSNMRFGGPYSQSDIGLLYGDRDLTWAIDMWQSGQNADWLLPNRIYEGGFFNCPPIALAGTETARWLAARGAGFVVQDLKDDLETFITTLTPTRYAVLKRTAEAVPSGDLAYSVAECRSITERLLGGVEEAKEEARALA
jgi:succinoglycan biosynthesis protein ExoL